MFLIPKLQNYIFINALISFQFYPSRHSHPLFPAFPPLFPTFLPWFPAFPPWFPAFLPWLPAFPSFLAFPLWLPAFPPRFLHPRHDFSHSLHSPHSIPRPSIPAFTDSRFECINNCQEIEILTFVFKLSRV